MIRRSVLLFLVLPCLAASLPCAAQTAHFLPPSSKSGYHVYGHSHNDYEHARPLMDALDNRFYSVEADFWLVNGELLISHHEGNYKGTLKDLYLDPLQKRVDEKGSVQGDGEAFYLWLDIKDGSEAVHPLLHELLQHYSMLTVFIDQSIDWRPVVIILTGDKKSKESYVEKYPERRVCRDSNDYSPTDPKADNRWLWYAVSLNKIIPWNGKNELTPDDQRRFVEVVNDIHAKGRKVRFYAAPDMEAYWELAWRSGVDLINTDMLSGLNHFLDTVKP